MCYLPLHDSANNGNETFTEWWGSIMYYLEQLAEGAWLKAVLATATAFFLDFLHGDLQVMYIYLAFSFADLYFGRKLAKRMGLYDVKKMKFWARKQLTHLTLVVMVGALGHSTYITSKGLDISIVNWMFLFLTYVEAASVEDKLKLLGWPIHPIIHKMFGIMRKKACHDFSRLVDDPTIRREMEEALRQSISPPQAEGEP